MLEKSQTYNKFMGELLSTKEELKTKKVILLTEICSFIITKKLPEKGKDLGIFTIPYSIEDIKIKYGLCDLRASMNMMSLSMFKFPKKEMIKLAKITLTLANGTVKFPYGIVEDVMVKANQAIFSEDFVILDMQEDQKYPLLLGRPFL